MSLHEMAKMQHKDASSTLILLRKYIFNFTLWHETILLLIMSLFILFLNYFFLNFFIFKLFFNLLI